ncbi:hypothetical protein Bca101_058067 [Brassica carinata]
MIFIGLGVWQTYVVRRFSPRAISRSIRRYRVPPFSSPVFSLFKLTIRFLFSDLKSRNPFLHRRSVTAWDHIFSDQIFSDNIFSDCKSSIFCLKTTVVVFY